MSFDGLVIRKNILLKSSHHIETHLDVFVEFLEVQISDSFEFYLDEEFIEFWWSDLMFQSLHVTHFCRLSTVQ